MSKTFSVGVSETIQVQEQLSTYKRWFNGVKKFFTVKVLPPSK